MLWVTSCIIREYDCGLEQRRWEDKRGHEAQAMVNHPAGSEIKDCGSGRICASCRSSQCYGASMWKRKNQGSGAGSGALAGSTGYAAMHSCISGSDEADVGFGSPP
jgi:hypothetical protein